MKIALVVSALALLAGGCIESHHARVVYYTPAPTSDRTDVRVYSTQPTAPPPNVVTSDVALADQISGLLKGDSHMRDISQSVLVKVKDGGVDLRGSVPSENARAEIVDRVSLLPGVRSINNELGVER